MKPPESASQYRGRTIRFGDHEGETDAVAVAPGDTLIIVECKGLHLTDDRVNQTFRGMNSIATALDSGLAQGKRIAEVLTRKPVVQGPYDFSDYATFKYMVCTPTPFYYKNSANTEEVIPGLRRVSSANELAEFLGVDPFVDPLSALPTS
jgi:hypothetical protein